MKLTNDMAKKLTPERLRAFFEGRGWHSLPFPNPKLQVFSPPEDPRFGFAVPATQDVSDYAGRIEQTIEAMASYFEETEEAILDEMLNGTRRQHPAP